MESLENCRASATGPCKHYSRRPPHAWLDACVVKEGAPTLRFSTTRSPTPRTSTMGAHSPTPLASTPGARKRLPTPPPPRPPTPHASMRFDLPPSALPVTPALPPKQPVIGDLKRYRTSALQKSPAYGFIRAPRSRSPKRRHFEMNHATACRNHCRARRSCIAELRPPAKQCRSHTNRTSNRRSDLASHWRGRASRPNAPAAQEPAAHRPLAPKDFSAQLASGNVVQLLVHHKNEPADCMTIQRASESAGQRAIPVS